MNTQPIAHAITVSSMAFASAWIFSTFATLYTASQSWFDHVIAWLPFLGALVFVGIIYQLTMNTPERQSNRRARTGVHQSQ